MYTIVYIFIYPLLVDQWSPGHLCQNVFLHMYRQTKDSIPTYIHYIHMRFFVDSRCSLIPFVFCGYKARVSDPDPQGSALI
jgi:hypothetical protein